MSKQEDKNEHEEALTSAVVSELEEEGGLGSNLASQHGGAKNEGWDNNSLSSSQDTAARSRI